MTKTVEVVMPIPKAAPLFIEVRPEHAQDIWDAFVKPEQEQGLPQSVEMRMLMALLRAFHQGRVTEGRTP